MRNYDKVHSEKNGTLTEVLAQHKKKIIYADVINIE